MHILALQPYDGGSHKAFLDGWARHSRHTFTVLRLPPHHWKWRMRHAAVTFANQLAAEIDDATTKDGSKAYDAVWCTSMLDLATFRGLCPPPVACLPAAVYFHENQLTYPPRPPEEEQGSQGHGGDPRDVHFALTHVTSGLAAQEIWWNSAFNRDSFLEVWRETNRKMPGREFDDAAGVISSKSRILEPGIDVPLRESCNPSGDSGASGGGGLRIVWTARWEHDKDPRAFFEALYELDHQGVDFRVDVLGEAFRQVPPVFAEAKARLKDRIDQWGFAEERDAYIRCLQRADVAVSTAKHEFFGLSMVEAVAAGAVAVVPDRLAYPRVFGKGGALFYDGTQQGLVEVLTACCHWLPPACPQAVAAYQWPAAADRLDEAMAALTGR